jgi:hypothetical protein
MSVDGMWYVKLADGDVDRVTLDQLDEAFQNGQVDENSMVLADGADRWMKLADLLGLSEGAAPAPAAIAQPVAMQAPVAMPPLVAGRATQPPIVVQGQVATKPGVATQRPIAAQPPLGMAPPLSMPPIPVTASLRPVSVDLGSQIELGDLQFRGSSRKRWVVGMLGTVLVLGAGAFFVVTKTASSARADATRTFAAATAAQPPPAPETPAPPPPPVVAPAPQATNAGPSSVMDPTQRLTDEQKRKILEAEKSVKSHPKSRSGGGGGTYHPKEKSSGFTTGGNKFDPLNSSL